jgi:ABC-2 type transport system ATP-binding protein
MQTTTGPRATASPRNGHGPAPAGEAADGAVIRTSGLTKRYGDLVAVDHLDLEVRSGEIFGLLGPNGAGKTTTILMLLGLSEPTSGEVRVLGLDPTRASLSVKRRVGYLPDNAGFYGAMTGRENLRYTARLNGLSGRSASALIDGVLEQVGLTGRADDRTETYSRGMRQRLGIADALVKEPPILILDEPTTAIDPIGVAEILDLIRGLARERGIAILLASHLLDQVQTVCHRVGIFHEGRLVGRGSVDELASAFGEGSGRLEVGVEAVDPEAEARVPDLLRSIPGVVAVEPAGPDSLGRRSWLLAIASDRAEHDVGQAVVGAVLGAGLRLERFGRERPSLERIYRLAVERATDAERPAGGHGSLEGAA